MLNGQGGIIQIAESKTKVRRRLLAMAPAVHRVLKARHDSQGYAREGWVFPSGSEIRHMEQGSAKNQHPRALKDSNVKRFLPCVLRRTALTWLATMGVLSL